MILTQYIQYNEFNLVIYYFEKKLKYFFYLNQINFCNLRTVMDIEIGFRGRCEVKFCLDKIKLYIFFDNKNLISLY